MSRYEKLCKQKPKEFKRLIGVKEETFAARPLKISCQSDSVLYTLGVTNERTN
jgi:hypothetical protein